MHDDTMVPLSKKPKPAPRAASLVCEGGKPVGQCEALGEVDDDSFAVRIQVRQPDSS